jgi:hypothetical protein
MISGLVANISSTLDQGLDPYIVQIQQEGKPTKDIHVEEKGTNIGVSPCYALHCKFEDKHQED